MVQGQGATVPNFMPTHMDAARLLVQQAHVVKSVETTLENG